MSPTSNPLTLNPTFTSSNPTSQILSPNPHITSQPQFPSSSSSHTQKKKLSKSEIEHFSKRLRKVVEGLELVYFDPDSVTFILRSRLEYFILDERNKPINHDESFSFNNHSSISDSVCDSTSVAMAEEAGLIMPPTSP